MPAAGDVETPVARTEYSAPDGTTHWKIKKRDDAARTWLTQSWTSMAMSDDGANTATLQTSMFDVASWPRTQQGIVELVSSRWGQGAYRVWFFRKEGGERPKQMGGVFEMAVSPMPTAGAPPAPANGAQQPPLHTPQVSPAASVFGAMGAMFGGAPHPALAASNDPMAMAMAAFQLMLTWQTNQTIAIRDEADARARREREERDKAFENELARTREHHRELERMRLERESEREGDKGGLEDELEELRDKVKELEAGKQGSGLPKGYEWIGIVKEILPAAMPTLEKMATAALKAAASGGGGGGGAAGGGAPPAAGAT